MGLPDGWVWKTLGDVCLPPQYGWTTSASSIGKLHLLRTTDITSGFIDWGSVPYCSQEPPMPEKYLVQDSDIVISRAGSVGFSHLIKNPRPAVFASYLIRFRPLINEKYVAFFLQSPSYWQAISEKKLGIAIPNVNATKLRQISIPVPPFPEQERIVAKIEELFTQLDTGVAALRRVQAGLKRYKASVLKSACEGRLVPQDPNDEPAEELLRRMGKMPQEAEELSILPEGWCWVRWDQVGVSQNGRGFPSNEYQEDGVKLLRPGNLSANGKVVWTNENTRRLPENWAAKYPNFIICPNELVINLTAQSLKDEFLGRVCLTGPEEYCLLNQRLARLKPLIGDTKFFWILFKSFSFRQFVDGLNTGSLIQHMFTRQLAEFTFPIPPILEQSRIVAEVERRLSVMQEIEAVLATSLARAARLRQSILKRAFEGRLVSQAVSSTSLEARSTASPRTEPSPTARQLTLPDFQNDPGPELPIL